MSRLVRRLGIALALPALTLGLVTTPASAHTPRTFPTRIELPNAFLPEGIAIRNGIAYFGSRADGDIYAASLRTGKGKVISQGPGTPSVGLKVDNRGRLFVAGGPAGNARVVDSRSGKILKTYTFATAPTFVNDVILGLGAAWFTDSQKPVLYRVPFGKHGKLAPQSAVRTIPLTGDYVHQTGFNLNGIALTPDHRSLLVVQSATGLLFKVNPWTGVTKRVDLGGALMTNGDGLLVLGRTLYVVQNQLNRVAVVKLNSAGTRGTLVRTITSPDFDIPTTAAAFGKRLYLPNARFNTPPMPDTPYWVTAVRR